LPSKEWDGKLKCVDGQKVTTYCQQSGQRITVADSTDSS
jgi:hypothetical protein